ncbi:hypothetical protein [Sphingomonas nostoxanthinifaciens]|uniref:hypothetical protein n=1 Tax=Sphingomonas nostoxanthinifaciens TaxID=2872652 RepID=UPI001CC1CE62|nr:hypothetical protein [Sphingomonas nostoxanthinifaciens]UAK25268.1 hypothetical protein K8P63_03475 [Sphingomonas nostoxanthinifaciens]
MRIVSTMALALAIGGMAVATPVLAKEKKEAAAKYTPAVQNALAAAQTALKANDVATATAKVNEAKAAAQNDEDRYATGSIEYQISRQNNDQAMQSDAIDLMIASNKAPPEQMAQLLLVQGQVAYQAKNWSKAITSLTAAQKAGSTEPNLVPVLVTSMANNGQTAQALTTLNSLIDQTLAAGKPVPQEWYQQGISIGYKTQASSPDAAAVYAATGDLTKKWVAAYPTKSNWHDAMTIYMSQNKVPTDIMVDVFRLERAAGALGGDAEYREYAEDVYLRIPNEAKVVLEEGVSKGIVNATNKDAAEVLGLVKGKVAADQASLAQSDKAARTAANGKTALSTADGYVSYSQYDKAIDLYKLALTKGGVDAPTVNLHLGWALALKGDAAGAKAAFAQVTGARKALADFWVVHLDHPTQG